MPKISALPPATRAAQDDELPMHNVADGETQKVTVQMLVPTGSILDYAGANAPAGFLLCYGQSLDATANPEYADLYDAIGVTYGGSGITAFNVPDLRGRVAAGQDDMGGSSANRLTNAATGGIDGDALGGTGGAETAVNPLDSATSHAKMLIAAASPWAYIKRKTVAQFTATHQSPAGTGAGSSANNTVGTELGGDTAAGNNVQPTIILNKIIKY